MSRENGDNFYKNANGINERVDAGKFGRKIDVETFTAHRLLRGHCDIADGVSIFPRLQIGGAALRFGEKINAVAVAAGFERQGKFDSGGYTIQFELAGLCDTAR